MDFSIAVTGAINSGKSTLARALAKSIGAVLLGSDDIRASLSRSQSRHGDRVFATMEAMLNESLLAGACVVLDSTGMSPRFRAILRERRSAFRHVHLRLERVEEFDRRERERRDRVDSPVPRAAFYRSCRVAFDPAPDLSIVTDSVEPLAVYEIACRYLQSAALPLEAKDT